MTLKQAAALLGVTPDNLRQSIARGSLQATKLGRDWFVTEDEVERYRAEHRRTSSGAGDGGDTPLPTSSVPAGRLTT